MITMIKVTTIITISESQIYRQFVIDAITIFPYILCTIMLVKCVQKLSRILQILQEIEWLSTILQSDPPFRYVLRYCVNGGSRNVRSTTQSSRTSSESTFTV